MPSIRVHAHPKSRLRQILLADSIFIFEQLFLCCAHIQLQWPLHRPSIDSLTLSEPQIVQRTYRILPVLFLLFAGSNQADEVRVNFGGSPTIDGWNSFSGDQGPAVELTDADGEPTGIKLEMIDPFQSFENPNVAKGELVGEAAAFEPARQKTLFTASAKGNPTGGFVLHLEPGQTYTLTFWASRTGNGKRWTKYIVEGAETSEQMLAAGGDASGPGNLSAVARFVGVVADEEGKVTVTVTSPSEEDPYVNYDGFAYLTGMILEEQSADEDDSE